MIQAKVNVLFSSEWSEAVLLYSTGNHAFLWLNCCLVIAVLLVNWLHTLFTTNYHITNYILPCDSTGIVQFHITSAPLNNLRKDSFVQT